MHGLNVRPEAMMPLINWLTQHGSDVYLIRLTGHTTDPPSISEITSQAWLDETMNGYQIARHAATRDSVPLFFLGYSLGALLGQIIISRYDAVVDRQVLIAPATAIRDRSYLLKFMFLFSENRILPSYTPAQVRANKGLPIKIYKILFGLSKDLVKARFDKVNIPTLTIVDPRDELVSYRKLRRHKRKYNLTEHQIIKLDTDLNGRSTKYHHLIISEPTMGETNWRTASASMAKFLFANE